MKMFSLRDIKWEQWNLGLSNIFIYSPALPVPGCAVHRYRLHGGEKGLHIRYGEIQWPATICWQHACRGTKIYSNISESAFLLTFLFALLNVWRGNFLATCSSMPVLVWWMIKNLN